MRYLIIEENVSSGIGCGLMAKNAEEAEETAKEYTKETGKSCSIYVKILNVAIEQPKVIITEV